MNSKKHLKHLFPWSNGSSTQMWAVALLPTQQSPCPTMKKRNSWQLFMAMQDTGCLSQFNETLVHLLISGHRNICVRDIETTIRIFASSV